MKNLKGKDEKPNWESEEPPKQKSQSSTLIGLINLHLFKEYIKSISTLSSRFKDRSSTYDKCVKKYSNHSSFYEMPTSLKPLDFEQDIGSRFIYSYGDYPKICLFVVISNAEWIVYILLFIKLYMYANLESLIPMLSVLVYAMLK